MGDPNPFEWYSFLNKAVQPRVSSTAMFLSLQTYHFIVAQLLLPACIGQWIQTGTKVVEILPEINLFPKRVKYSIHPRHILPPPPPPSPTPLYQCFNQRTVREAFFNIVAEGRGLAREERCFNSFTKFGSIRKRSLC